MLSPHLEPLEYRSKPQELCAQLMALAYQLGPEAKLPTVAELRKSLGVSLTTLNSALGTLEEQGVIERKHGVGIYVSAQLKRDKTAKAISLVCDPAFFQAIGHSPFWDLLVEQARQRAASRDEEFSFHFAVPSGHGSELLHDGLVNEIKAGRVQGIIAVGLHPTATRWITEAQVPLVAFAGWAGYTVGLDGVELIRQGVEALAQQGCQRIGLWESVAASAGNNALVEPAPPDSATIETFRQALTTHALNFHLNLVSNAYHSLIGVYQQAAVTKQEQGYRTALEVFGKAKSVKPDGVIITDDMMTHGALTALQKLGVRVGHDVHIATHANRGSPVLLGYEDEITLMEIDPAAIVQTLFSLLQTLMAGAVPTETIVLIKPRLKRPTLVEFSSVRKVAKLTQRVTKQSKTMLK